MIRLSHSTVRTVFWSRPSPMHSPIARCHAPGARRATGPRRRRCERDRHGRGRQRDAVEGSRRPPRLHRLVAAGEIRRAAGSAACAAGWTPGSCEPARSVHAPADELLVSSSGAGWRAEGARRRARARARGQERPAEAHFRPRSRRRRRRRRGRPSARARAAGRRRPPQTVPSWRRATAGRSSRGPRGFSSGAQRRRCDEDRQLSASSARRCRHLPRSNPSRPPMSSRVIALSGVATGRAPSSGWWGQSAT
jgi:hypothetical protein